MSQAPERPPVAEADGLSSLAGVAPVGVPSGSIPEYRGVPLTIPATGVYMTSDHRYYWNGQGPMPSVTTVLEVLSKPALVQWLAKESARACIRHWSDLSTVLESEGEEAAVNWAVKKGGEQRDKAAKLGTGVHYLADIVARQPADEGMAPGASEKPYSGFQPSEQEMPYVAAFRAFLAFLGAQGGRIVSSEHAVWSLNGYAGTYDLIVELPCGLPGHDRIPDTCPNPDLWLIDIKTSKGFYPEYALQLAAYGHADYIVLPDDATAYPMPPIQRYGVLHLRPDKYPLNGYRLVEYPVTYDDYLTFLGALEIHKWRKADRYSLKNLNGSQEPPTTASAILLPPTAVGDKHPQP